MTTSRAMKQCNIRYFSQLSAKQKDSSANYIRMIIAGLTELPFNFAMQLLLHVAYVPVSLEGEKMCKLPANGIWIPLDIKRVLNESNELTKN